MLGLIGPINADVRSSFHLKMEETSSCEREDITSQAAPWNLAPSDPAQRRWLPCDTPALPRRGISLGEMSTFFTFLLKVTPIRIDNTDYTSINQQFFFWGGGYLRPQCSWHYGLAPMRQLRINLAVNIDGRWREQWRMAWEGERHVRYCPLPFLPAWQVRRGQPTAPSLAFDPLPPFFQPPPSSLLRILWFLRVLSGPPLSSPRLFPPSSSPRSLILDSRWHLSVDN